MTALGIRSVLLFLLAWGSVSGQTASPSQNSSAVERTVSWKTLIPNLLDDQVRVYTFPARLFHGRDLLQTGLFAGATAGLVALDPVEARYFRRTTSFQGLNSALTSNATSIGIIVAP